MPEVDPRRHAPATRRNREPILAVLQRLLPPAGLLLEVASGTGEHAAFMAPRLPEALVWQPSEADAAALAGIDAHAAESGAGNVLPAIVLDATSASWPVARADAVFAANLLHIAPWRVTEGLFAGAARVLGPAGLLLLYGPFKRHGEHTAPSNAAFDTSLGVQNPAWRIRCLDGELCPLAEAVGLALDEVVALPANNLMAVWRRR